jgi:hypothetical protein
MRFAIPGSRKFGISSAFASLWLLTAACSESAVAPPLYSVVDGSWSTNCIARQNLFAAYRIELEMRNARDVTRREYYFADDACAEPLASLEYRGIYELIVTSRDFIYAIDLMYDAQSLSALNAVGQQRLEEKEFCGRLQWPLAEAQDPLSFDPAHCTAVGPLPLKNLNLVQINRGFSLDFGTDLAHENERPLDVRIAPELVFLSQPLP